MKYKGMDVASSGVAVAAFLLCSNAMALPFNIAPNPNVLFPASINQDQPTLAIYTIKNNTSYYLKNIYLTNLPAGVSQVTGDSLCGAPFNLAPGASCNLQLSVQNSVQNNQNANNLQVCIPGAAHPTCQGFALNIPSSGWSLVGSSTIGPVNGYIYSLVANAATLYAGGHDSNDLAQLWSYIGGVWTVLFTGSSHTTGAGSTFATMSFVNATSGYLGGYNNEFGTIYSVDLSTSPVTVNNLDYKDYTLTPSGQTEYPYEVDSLLYNAQNDTLYIGGESSTDLINHYGVVYSYSGGTFTNLALENDSFVDALAIANNTLYVATIGEGLNFAEVFALPLNGGSWTDTYVPNSVIEFHSLAVDSKGTLYAGGYDNNGGTIWKYVNGTWTSLNFTGGSNIESLAVDSNDVLYATGVNNNFQGGVWAYKNNVWITISPGSSSYIRGIALLSSKVYTAGQNNVASQCVWQR